MRRFVLLICLLALPLAGLAQVRQPRPKIELGDITLRDGRVLQGARLLGSGSSSRLNIAHKGGIEQVPIDAFGDDFIAAHGDLIKEARGEYLSESEIRAKAKSEQLLAENRKKTERKIAMMEAADREREAMQRSRRDIAEAEKQLKEREEREARIAAHKAAEFARSRDGLILDRFVGGFEGSTLTVRNVHDNPRRLDWRELRARRGDGREVIPVNCESTDERDRSLDIRSGQTRTFVLRWMGGNDDIQAITWADGRHVIERWKPVPKAVADASVPDGQ